MSGDKVIPPGTQGPGVRDEEAATTAARGFMQEPASAQAAAYKTG